MKISTDSGLDTISVIVSAAKFIVVNTNTNERTSLTNDVFFDTILKYHKII